MRMFDWVTYCEYDKKKQLWRKRSKVLRFFRLILKVKDA